MTDEPEPTAAAQRLIERVADHVLANGAGGTSLSELGRAIGSNNRMLLYYFGSKEEVLRRATLAAFMRYPHLEGALRRLREGDADLRARLLQVWADIAHPDNLPFLALFFQTFAVALYHPERNRPVFDRLGGDWVAEVRATLEAEGFAPEAALPIATQLVAEWRGLQFALLAGSPRGLLDAAHADLIGRLPLRDR